MFLLRQLIVLLLPVVAPVVAVVACAAAAVAGMPTCTSGRVRMTAAPVPLRHQSVDYQPLVYFRTFSSVAAMWQHCAHWREERRDHVKHPTTDSTTAEIPHKHCTVRGCVSMHTYMAIHLTMLTG